jgi:hemerythrin
MTRQQLVLLVLAIQEFRAWLEDDVTDTIEQQTCSYLISVIVDHVARMDREVSRERLA